MFHSTEVLVSVNLGILSTGLSLTSVGAINVIIRPDSLVEYL